ncbi:MAG: hypothetical protein M3Z85_21615 [Acidobacteriota bacterium]|nr:hypothetical protein [Acidobacteriota bacterium]
MNRLVTLILLCPLLVLAQFSELAASDNGRHLYFSSTLKLKGQTPDRAEYRIYRVTETGGIELFAERGDLAFKFGGGSGDGARTPQISGDGQTVGLTLEGICESADGCMSNSQWRAEVRGRNAAVLGQGALSMSRSAKWALLTTAPTGIPAPGAMPEATLINLDTGERASVPAPPMFMARALASDGTVVVQNTGVGLGLWRAGKVTRVTIPGAVSLWALSDDGSMLLYRSVTIGADPANSRMRLMARDVTHGQDIELFAGAIGEFPQFMGASNDGRRVLYRVTKLSAAGPAFVADAATGRSSPILLPDGELATDGTLSGFGNAAFLLTTTGRIASVDLAAGALRDAVPPTPYIRNSSQFSPGSLVRLDGTLPHSAAALTDAIFLDNRAVPVLYANEKEIGIQVPWELANTFEAPLRVELASDTPFQQSVLVNIPGMSPRFEGTPPAGVALPGIAIKSDWSGLLTSDPQPGEVFHMYLTGLGVVQGTVRTGAATPIGPVFPIRGSIACRFTPYEKDAETLFAGLAPGLIGIYQVTFRIPEGLNPVRLTGGRCTFAFSNGGGSLIWSGIGSATP